MIFIKSKEPKKIFYIYGRSENMSDTINIAYDKIVKKWVNHNINIINIGFPEANKYARETTAYAYHAYDLYLLIEGKYNLTIDEDCKLFSDFHKNILQPKLLEAFENRT